MTITPKIYTGCPRKHSARQVTIIDVYKKLYGKSIPQNKQYWSMCALCADENGIIEDSELDQLVESKLINPNQFNGVDFNKEIYEKNKLYTKSKWYNCDFLTAMKEAQKLGKFNPCIVNADLINMPNKAAIHAGRILNFLYENNHIQTILVLNTVIKCHNRFSSVEELSKNLCKESNFRFVWNTKKWKLLENSAYLYNGTQSKKKTFSDSRNPKTIMATIVFVPNNI